MHKEITLLVSAQIDINRAVFAANQQDDVKHLSFKTEEERNKYLIKCAKSAIEELSQFIKSI